MGFFTNNSSAVGSELQPLSRERVMAALDALEISYEIDDEGDVYAGWDLGIVYFLIRGDSDEILFAQGYWRATLPQTQFTEAAIFANGWNSEKLWPRTLVRVTETGELRMETGHIVDYEHGLTDEQLGQHLMSAIAPSMSFFEELNERFPEAWAAATAED